MSKRVSGRGSPGEDGFTLIELILAILILGVITVPLGNVVIGYFRNTDATTARLLESHDVQVASAYWAQDVASVGTRSAAPTYALTQSVELNAAYNSGPNPCGPTGTPNAIVRLAWDDFSSAGPASVVRVAYVRQGTELHRLRCIGSATLASDVTVAHYLDPATAPAVACLGTSGSSCAAAPAVPTEVDLKLTLKNPNNRDSAYVVTLTGQRRQSP